MLIYFFLGYLYAALYLAADVTCFNKVTSFLRYMENVVQNGIDFVELRYNGASNAEYFEVGKDLHKIMRQTHIPLLINRPAMITSLSSTGVCIEVTKQQSYPNSLFDMLKRNNKLIGVSITDQAQLAQLPSYTDFLLVESVLGKFPCMGLRQLQSINKKIKYPTIIFGGIEVEVTQTIMNCGGSGIGIISHPLYYPPNIFKRFKQELLIADADKQAR